MFGLLYTLHLHTPANDGGDASKVLVEFDLRTPPGAFYLVLICPFFFYLVCFHCFTDPVAGSVMNDLQVLVDGGLEPVVKARQGQHLSVPVKTKTRPLVGREPSSTVHLTPNNELT